MIKFTGRSSLKQYMPMKAIKWDIKVWVLGDSSNGYFSNFQIYTGKVGATAETGLGARVVKDLTHDLIFLITFYQVWAYLLTWRKTESIVERQGRTGEGSPWLWRSLRCLIGVSQWESCIHNYTHTYTLHTLVYVFVHVYMYTRCTHAHIHSCSGIFSQKWKAWVILNNKCSGIEVGIASEFFSHPLQVSDTP